MNAGRQPTPYRGARRPKRSAPCLKSPNYSHPATVRAVAPVHAMLSASDRSLHGHRMLMFGRPRPMRRVAGNLNGLEGPIANLDRH
jgi:hypothetical protein